MFPRAVHLHATAILASPAVRSGALSWQVLVPGKRHPSRERRNLTAADLLVLLPWLVFAAGLAVIGWRLLASHRARARRSDRR